MQRRTMGLFFSCKKHTIQPGFVRFRGKNLFLAEILLVDAKPKKQLITLTNPGYTVQYPTMKTLYRQITRCILLGLCAIFTMAAFSFTATAQGKKVFVGTGSGFIDYPNAQATLNLQDGDTVVINPGRYKLMNFKNITASPGHKIYITNSGLVEFTDPSPSTFSNLTNVEIRGDGTPGIDFGFYMHDILKGILMDGTISGVYFSYFKMVNITDYGIFLSNPSLVYDGTNNKNSLFYDVKFLHFSVANIMTTFLQVGLYSRIIDDGLTNMTRNLEFAYSTIDYSDQFDVVHLNKAVNVNIHHNRFSHLGRIDFRHSAIIYLYGNGNIHHNYIGDYWGSGVRAHAFNLDSVGSINVYNNIMVNSRKYSGVEAQSTPEDMLYSPYVHYCNFRIYNNTFGNLSAYDWAAAMVDTYNASGGTIEIKNNLGFNIERDLPYNPAQNYIYDQLNITKPDTIGNIYSRNYTDLGLINDSSCFLNINSPAIDKGVTLSLVKDDIDGITRPQSGAYDVGAREYLTGIVFPVANAGADTSTVLPKDSLLLNGAGSYNPTGGLLKYKWLQLSGPSTALFVNDSLSNPLVKNLLQGTYQFKLRVTNAQGQSNEDAVLLVVSPVPVFPPVANAGGTTTIVLPVNSSFLNGAASTNSAGGTLKYSWVKTAGPSGFTISGDTTARPLVSSLTEGTYQFTLTVTNSNGLSNSDIATIIVQPAPIPTANAGADIYIALPVNTATLDGSASSTQGGGPLSYAWTKVSGPASFAITGDTNAIATISNLTQGVYQCKLTVTNSAGITSTDFVNINVAAAPLAVANAGGDISLTLPANITMLNGTGSYSTGGGALTYNWLLLSGPGPLIMGGESTSTPTVTNLQEGVYQVKLTVTNIQGSTATDTVKITVSAIPVYPPVSNAGSDITITLPASSVKLNGDQSYNPTGGTITYSWTLVAGPPSFTITGASSATPTISSLTEGEYQLRLTVTNEQGASSQDDVVVTVKPLPPVPPVANAGADIAITLPVNTVTLNGSASSNAAGGSLTYSWIQVSGPSAATINGPATATPVLNGLIEGVYHFKLVVTNAQGLSAEDVVTVTVLPLVYPVANAGSDISIVLPQNSTTLNGSASNDPTGGNISYSWSLISGPASFSITGNTSATPTIGNLIQGVYQLKLTVTNAIGLTAEDMVQVTVLPAVYPVANAGGNINIVLPVNTVQPDGSASYDPAGRSISYSWSKVSGPPSFTLSANTSARPSISNLTIGVYQLKLTVTTSDGLTAEDMIIITVNPAPVPVAITGRDTTIHFPGGWAWADATASYPTGGASIVAYHWQQLAGPTTAIIGKSDSVKTGITNLEPGVYHFQLGITDSKGQQDTAIFTVTVLNDMRYQKSIMLYPNPCISNLHVRAITDSTGNLLVRITNLSGIVMKLQQFKKNQLLFDESVDINGLPGGMYILEVIIEDKVALLSKFVKRG